MSAPTPHPPAAGLVVRELRWSDFHDLKEAYYLLYEERETNLEIGITLFRTMPSHEDEVGWFAGLYRNVLTGNAIVAIAERDGHAIGNCSIRRLGPTQDSEMSHVAELGIMVHRDHRSTGVGRALLESALGQCRGKFSVVRLGLFSVNVRARRLYERFGFVFVGRVPGAVLRNGRSFDEDLMVLELRPPDGG